MEGLHHFIAELYAVGAEPDEYVIFGSTALYLRGIIDRMPGDVDAFVTKRVWGLLLPRPGWIVEVPRAGDPPILHHDSNPDINLFYAWTHQDDWMVVSDVFASASIVKGYRVCSVEEVKKHKLESTLKVMDRVQKHIDDIQSIEASNA